MKIKQNIYNIWTITEIGPRNRMKNSKRKFAHNKFLVLVLDHAEPERGIMHCKLHPQRITL
jgi:hypothetical protein